MGGCIPSIPNGVSAPGDKKNQITTVPVISCSSYFGNVAILYSFTTPPPAPNIYSPVLAWSQVVKFHIFTVQIQIFLSFSFNFFAAGGPWGPQGEGGPLRDPSVPHQASPPLLPIDIKSTASSYQVKKTNKNISM